MNLAQRGLVLLARGYQKTLSPLLAAALGPSSHCRFQPTCSHYAVEAVQRRGAVMGSWLALCRLARCHPWGKFGEDPVPGPANARTLKFNTPELGTCHHGP